MNLPTNDQKKKKKRWLKVLVWVGAILLIVGGIGIGAAQMWYDNNLKPVSASTNIVRVEIPLGSSVDDIANILKDKNVIRNALAFRTYVRGKEFGDSLRAGVYELDSSKSVQDIVSIMISGEEASDLFTIPPGLRLDQIKDRFIKAGFTQAEVDAGFAPEQYRQHPALVAKPRDASLEGYLFPESFKITSSSTVKDIVTMSLDQMALRLTPDRIEDFARHGLTSHQAIILASLIEEEVISAEDRRVVAQIFIKRLDEGISLGSDVTYEYAAAITGGIASPSLDSPYNTRIYAGLPPGPISNSDDTALEAVANPANTSYLFFVSGDDGKTYYANDQEGHDENIKNFCKKNCR